MTFSGDENDISGTSRLNGKTDRFPAILHREISSWFGTTKAPFFNGPHILLSKACFNLSEDIAGGFTPWIIGRDNGEIAQSSHPGPH